MSLNLLGEWGGGGYLAQAMIMTVTDRESGGSDRRVVTPQVLKV